MEATWRSTGDGKTNRGFLRLVLNSPLLYNFSMGIFKHIWDISGRDQYRTVDDLIERATPNVNYYTLLVLSTLVITAGVLMSNTAVLIGGMLITPLLTPILVIALGITTGQPQVTGKAFRLVARSLMFVVGGALVLGILFGQPSGEILITNSMRDTLLYLIVAVGSGVAATYAWIKKEAFEALPGVAIAVSLVPPAAYIGVGLGTLEFEIARMFFVILAVNVIGIIGGSMVVFSQFGFYKTRKIVEKKAEEQEKIAKEQKDLDMRSEQINT